MCSSACVGCQNLWFSLCQPLPSLQLVELGSLVEVLLCCDFSNYKIIALRIEVWSYPNSAENILCLQKDVGWSNILVFVTVINRTLHFRFLYFQVVCLKCCLIHLVINMIWVVWILFKLRFIAWLVVLNFVFSILLC